MSRTSPSFVDQVQGQDQGFIVQPQYQVQGLDPVTGSVSALVSQ